MKGTTKILVMITGLALATGAIASGGGKARGAMPPRGGPDMGGQVIEQLGKAIRSLDLTDDQKLAIHDEFSQFKESVKPLLHDLHEGKQELRGIVLNDEYDESLIADLAGRQGDLTTEITIIASGAAATVLSHLTDDQRAELRALAENRKAIRAEFKQFRKEQMKARKESRIQEGDGDS